MTHTELGAAGEAYVARLLSSVGLQVQYEGPADMMVEGNAIEVKAARVGPYRSGGYQSYQFCLHRRGRSGLQAATLILLCFWDTARESVAFVIPAQEVSRRRKIVIPGQPWTYLGMWSRYYQRWEFLADLLEKSCE